MNSCFDSRAAVFGLVAIAVAAVLAERSVYAAETGLTLFENHCAPCHGVDGKARTPAGKKLGAKDLSESKLGDEEIKKQIREGAKDPRGAEKMPSFKQKVTSEEIEAIVAYVKTFRSRH
jgi:mono/diheme cytochrome c family protein